MNTKIIILKCCKYAFYTGVGNYWDENTYKETFAYKLYTYMSFTLYTILVLLEYLAALFGNFPIVEKNSAFMFSAIHGIVLLKMYLFLYHKKSVKKLNVEMCEIGSVFEQENIMQEQYRKVKIGIILYVASVYMSLISYGIESARKVLFEDTPFYTVVTYLPKYDDVSIYASFFRVFFYITWLYMMLPMMATDSFAITHLIFLTFKFKTLCMYYERLRIEFEKKLLENGQRDETVNEMRASFLDGVQMHQRLLSSVNEIHRVFGMIMSMQVCESSAVAVLLLLRLALSPHLDLTNAFMTYTFVGSLFLLLALNLWNAGEVTYQASLLSNAIFDCGWHLCDMKKAGKELRHLVLISCTQAQKPLVLKAFGIQDLSYETFVSVAKATYSVFAVFYQRGE